VKHFALGFIYVSTKDKKNPQFLTLKMCNSHRQNTHDRRKNNTCAAHHLDNNAYCNAVCEYSQL